MTAPEAAQAIPSDVAVITCAINGVLTDPRTHPVPVTPEQLARSARGAVDAGASVIHLHFRDQRPGQGHRVSWDPQVAEACVTAIREAVPGVVINQTTGVPGRDVAGPLACLRRVRPEMAACNAGSLNYLKTRASGEWAWPPLLFDNPVEKVAEMLEAMAAIGAVPEFECFDTGIVRSVAMFCRNGMYDRPPHYNFVMGVASGMPADPDLLPLLLRHIVPGAPWQVTAVGRSDIWALHQRAADLGGHLRAGLEDGFYLPDGSRARDNAELIAALAECAARAGRRPATLAEARAWL